MSLNFRLLIFPEFTKKSVSVLFVFFQLFINNEWHESCNGGKIPVYNPATGKLLCEVEEADSVRTLYIQ